MGKECVTMSIFPTRILLATDGSDQAELATLTAVGIAEKTDSELHVVHVGVVPRFLESYPGVLGYERRLYEQIEEESRERLRGLSWRVKVAGGTVAGSHLRMGAVALEVVALAKELGVGLIVIGCRGHRGIRRVIEGSISDAVIRHAPCPVLVVRSPERSKAPGRRPIIHVNGLRMDALANSSRSGPLSGS
jgi:nucleotide-binding universal stress UspA family protein